MYFPRSPALFPVESKVFDIARIAIFLEGIDVPLAGNGCKDDKLVNATEYLIRLLRLPEYHEQNLIWKRGDGCHFFLVDLNDVCFVSIVELYCDRAMCRVHASVNVKLVSRLDKIFTGRDFH